MYHKVVLKCLNRVHKVCVGFYIGSLVRFSCLNRQSVFFWVKNWHAVRKVCAREERQRSLSGHCSTLEKVWSSSFGIACMSVSECERERVCVRLPMARASLKRWQASRWVELLWWQTGVGIRDSSWRGKDSEGAGGKHLYVCAGVLHGLCRGCHLLLKEQSLVLMAGCQWRAPGSVRRVCGLARGCSFQLRQTCPQLTAKAFVRGESVVGRSMCICVYVRNCGWR